jgi:hypothetical protein
MANYGLFYLNDQGHVCASASLTAVDDAEAQHCADEQHDGPMELWQLDRLVKKYPAIEPKS